MVTTNFTPDTLLLDYYEFSYVVVRLVGKSHRTIEEYRTNLRRFLAFHLELRQRPPRLGDLTDELLGAFIAWQLQNGVSAATANKNAETVCTIWRRAFKKKILTTIPDVEFAPEMERDRTVLTPDQLSTLIEAVDNLDGKAGKAPAKIFWGALLATVCSSAGRINAVMRLEWKDLDFESESIKLVAEHCKQKKDKRFTMLPGTADRLYALKAWTGDEVFRGVWEFDQDRPGKPTKWKTLREHYRTILTAANLPHGEKDLFHALRALTLTRIKREHGLEAACRFAGHSGVSVTKKYIDPVQGADLSDATAVFPEFTQAGRTGGVFQPRIFRGEF